VYERIQFAKELANVFFESGWTLLLKDKANQDERESRINFSDTDFHMEIPGIIIPRSFDGLGKPDLPNEELSGASYRFLVHHNKHPTHVV